MGTPAEEVEHTLSVKVAIGLLERPGPRNREVEEELGLSAEELAKECLGILRQHPDRLTAEHIKVIAGVRHHYPELREMCNQLYGLMVDHVDQPTGGSSHVA